MRAFPRRRFHTIAAALLFLALAALLVRAVEGAPILFRTGIVQSPAFTLSVPGDFDGDGDPDLVTQINGDLTRWTNTAGALGGAAPIVAPFAPTMFEAGDLDGDGRADLVLCAPASANGAIALLRSNGAGFDPATLVPTDSAGVVSATIADLDGDGDRDLVVVNRVTRKAHRLFNDGAGAFSGLASTRVPGEISRAWVADMNGDGNLDILGGHWPHLGVTFNIFGRAASASWTLPGTGGGAFGAPVPANVRSIVALGAFGAPGALDAFVYDSLGVGIAVKQPDGTFAPPVYTARGWPSCGEPFAAPIDLDGDGRDELVGSTGGGCSVSQWGVVRVDGALALTRRELYAGSSSVRPSVADFDGDGRPDAVAGSMMVAHNRDGNLDGARLLPRQEAVGTYDYVLDVDAADFDGNGAADVLVTSKYYSGGFFLSRHDRSFELGTAWQSNSYMRSSEVADFDGDGDLDVLQVHNDDFGDGLNVRLGDGAGHWTASTFVPTPSVYMLALMVADFDADGDLDAISEDQSGFVTWMFLNDGTANFSAGTCALPFSGTYARVAGDARPARFSTTGNDLVVEHSTAVGALGPPVATPTGGTLVTARFADVNGDGRTDAVCLMAGNEVRTFLGGAGGAWSAPIVSPEPAIAPGYTPVFAAIGNLDADGKPDLVFTGDAAIDAISVLRNLGGGAFGERGDSFTNQAFGTVIGDVDGDGAGDLLGIEPSAHPEAFVYPTAVNIHFGIPNDVATPALVSLVSASAGADGASLVWWVASGGPSRFDVERRQDGSAWTKVAEVSAVAGRIAHEDRAVEPGARYEWRLAWSEDGAAQYTEAVSLAIPALAAFGIERAQPNPFDGERVRVSLAVDRALPLEVRLIDVAGRVVASRRIAAPQPGRITVDFGGLGALSAGLYDIPAEQGGRRAAATIARLR